GGSGGLGGVGGGAALVEFLGGNPPLPGQAFGAGGFATAGLGLGAGAGQFGLGPGQGGAVGALVDHEQHLILLHLLAFLVGDAFDVTGHARPQLYGLHRLDAAGELAPGPELALRHFGHADFRRRRHAIAGGGLAAAAGCNGQRGQAEQAKCPAQDDLADGTRVSVLPIVARVHWGGEPLFKWGSGRWRPLRQEAVASATAGEPLRATAGRPTR